MSLVTPAATESDGWTRPAIPIRFPPPPKNELPQGKKSQVFDNCGVAAPGPPDKLAFNIQHKQNYKL